MDKYLSTKKGNVLENIIMILKKFGKGHILIKASFNNVHVIQIRIMFLQKNVWLQIDKCSKENIANYCGRPNLLNNLHVHFLF